MTPSLTFFFAESTLFAATALALVACLPGRSASTRHAVLLAAVAKFTLPLVWFVALGASLRTLLPYTLQPLATVPLFGTLPVSVTAPPLASHGHPLFTVGLAVWAMGALLTLSLWLRGWLASLPAKNIERCESASDLRTLDRMRRRLCLPRSPRLYLSATDDSPFVSGLFQPFLHIPQHLSQQLTQPEFEAVLLHELAHVKRRDTLTHALVHLVTCVFWFHPLLWWLERRLERESELACDDLVLSSGVPSEVYLRGICKVCELFLLNPAAGQSHLRGPNLKHRLERIVSLTPTRPRSTLAATLPGSLLLAVVLVLATAAGVGGSTAIHAQTPDSVADTSSRNCVWNSSSFPQGTAIRPTHHPELLQLCGNENGRPKWLKTSQDQVGTHSTPAVSVDDTPAPQSLSCKVTAPEGKLCTCDHLTYSPGSVVGSPQGRLVCPASTGKWQPFTGKQTPWPPAPVR